MIKWVTRREWVDTHSGEISYKEPENYKIIKKQIKTIPNAEHKCYIRNVTIYFSRNNTRQLELF